MKYSHCDCILSGRKALSFKLSCFILLLSFAPCKSLSQTAGQESVSSATTTRVLPSQAGPQDKKKKSPSSSQTERGITDEQASAILGELRAIRELLQKQAAKDQVILIPANQPNANINPRAVQLRAATHWHSLGRDDAPVTLLEFSDYECAFCRAFQAEIFSEMKKEYIDSGKVRFVSLDLPLPQHPQAEMAAEAARCAGDQGKYWELRSQLLTDHRPQTEEGIVSVGKSLSLDLPAFRNCLNSGLHNDEITEDAADADLLQITETPTFIVGKIIQGRLEGSMLVGVPPYSVLRARINEILAAPAH